MRYRHLPVARCRWALDSGAFSELSAYGRWTLTPEQYVAGVRRYRDEIGHLDWAAPMDYMCEPVIVAKTGLSVDEHMRRTVANYLELKLLAPDLPFIPVIQGWQLDDYLACVAMYEATEEIGTIVRALAERGLRIHGFGVKTEGLRRYGQYLASADSMAWSLRGRHVRGCSHGGHGRRTPLSESNCLHFASEWRSKVIGAEGRLP
jgi:hypothetical protein